MRPIMSFHHLFHLLLVTLVVFDRHTPVAATQLGDSDDIEPSYLEDSPCPNAEDIAPCTCLSVLGEPLEINCTGIADGQQLHDIFQASFPVKQFDILYLETYLFDTLSDDVFGEVMFRVVKTPDYGNGELASVGPETFIHMSPELRILSLGYNNFDTFPFDTLPSYPKLYDLSLRESPLTSFPTIQSESIRILDLSHGMYDTIPEGAFDEMPNLENIYVSSYIPLTITKGVFASVHHLKVLDIIFTPGLEHISSGQFEVNTTNLEYLAIRENGVETVDVDAFKGIQASSLNPNGTVLDMSGNRLTVVPEMVWRPVLHAGVKLDLSWNSLECGCDMAWLVLEQGYHHCVALECNGVELVDMDPSWYQDNC